MLQRAHNNKKISYFLFIEKEFNSSVNGSDFVLNSIQLK